MSKLKFIIIVLSINGTLCSIDGEFHPRKPDITPAGDDPCNPLYWYPRQIPEFCYVKTSTQKPLDMQPIPVPIPVPVPPMPVPIPPFLPPQVPPPGPPPPPIIPQPIFPLSMPLPYGIPLASTNPMMPVAGVPVPPSIASPYSLPLSPPTSLFAAPPPPNPFIGPPSPLSSFIPPLSPYNMGQYPIPYPPQGFGMLPGLPGLVTRDGGINILPFSDAYSDLLEKHKQKMIRRRLQKLLDEYDKYPYRGHKRNRHY